MDITAKITGHTGNLTIRENADVTATLEYTEDGILKVWFKSGDETRGPIGLHLTPNPPWPGTEMVILDRLPDLSEIQELYFILSDTTNEAYTMLSLYGDKSFSYFQGTVWKDEITEAEEKLYIELGWLRAANSRTIPRYTKLRMTMESRRRMNVR